MKLKSKKSALLMSFTSLLLCFAMLAGSTFAWFTDTATTGVNQIKSGTLDVGLEMAIAWDNEGNPTDWDNAEGKTLTFKTADNRAADKIFWEPNCTYELPELRVVNKGNLALKYKVEITGIKGDAKLNEVITWTIVEGETTNEVKKEGVATGEYFLLPAGQTTAPLTIKGHMDQNAGNQYQNLTIDGIGITVVATQYTYESDSISDQYDANADYTIQVNKDNIQDYLDGKYGPIDGMTLVLAEGEYGRIEFGRATAYAGSNTKYYLKGSETTVDAIKQAIAANPHGGAGTPVYVRSMSNVTLKAANGAAVTINGLVAFGGQVAKNDFYSKDFVVGRDMPDSVNYNTSYYIEQKWSNITFEGLTFTDGVNIEAYERNTLIDNVKFDNCSFNVNDDVAQTRCLRLATGGDCKSTGLAVTNCKFNDGYEGVLTIATTDVTVSGCTFTGLSKNAIDLLVGTNGYGKVTVTNNTIRDMGNGDGVILRLGAVDAKAALTIKGNTASGTLNFKDGRAIKVNSLAEGITYNISKNNWGGLTASHDEFN